MNTIKEPLKNCLILYTNKNDFDRFYLENMKSKNVDTYPIYQYKNKWLNYIMEAHFLSKFPGSSLWFGEWKYNLDKYSTVIVFEALPTEYVLKYIRKKNSICKIIYWYWNTLKKIPMNRDIAEYWSFDPEDCTKYNLRFNNQFGFIIGNRDEKFQCDTDVFFVGADKGRYNAIKKIEADLNKRNIKTNFLIVKDKTTKADNDQCRDTMIPYSEVIENVKKSRCLLDLVKEGQSGVTLRFIESVYYGKKVITNNKYVLQHQLYDQTRVFVLGHDKWENIYDFIYQDATLIPIERVKDFLYEGWIEKFDLLH